MLAVDMLLQFALAGAFHITEHTGGISVLFTDMGLELGVCSEAWMDGTTVKVEGVGDYAIGAEELSSAVDSLFVFAETSCTIESSITGFQGYRVDVSTRIRSELQMIRTDVSLKGLVLSKGLVAGRITCTSESFMALVCILMSFQTSRG
jgi:hypothetical protein